MAEYTLLATLSVFKRVSKKNNFVQKNEITGAAMITMQ
jgi:hypothetical protein